MPSLRMTHSLEDLLTRAVAGSIGTILMKKYLMSIAFPGVMKYLAEKGGSLLTEKNTIQWSTGGKMHVHE